MSTPLEFSDDGVWRIPSGGAMIAHPEVTA